VHIYPPTGLTDSQIEALEGQVAGRCLDLLIQTGIFLCAAVYASDLYKYGHDLFLHMSARRFP
jgi:hypothetical protein